MTDTPPRPGVPTEFGPGRVLGGKFRIEREIGVGGMGVVLAATHLDLDQPVALKVMLPKFASSPEAASRFAREARAAVKVRSEYIVRVLDVARLEDGTPYMVMEYLEGTDLSGLLATQGPLPPPTAVAYVLEACDAIAAAHGLGIIHRDLKPGNLFLARRGDGTQAVKVLDFGISKLSVHLSEQDATLTSTCAMMGSPPYMAPEQMLSAKNVDARTDIWGLGCVLYELLVGSRPFHGTTMPELCAAIMAESPAPPSRLRPGIAEGLDTVVLRCLEKSPAARYASVAELASALAPFSPESTAVVSGILRRVAPGGVASDAPPPNASENVRTALSWVRTRSVIGRPGRRRWIVLTTAAAIALGGAGVLGSWLARPPLATSAAATTGAATGARESGAQPAASATAPSGAATQPVVSPVQSQREPPAPSRAARPAVVRRASSASIDAGQTVAKPSAAETAPVPEPTPAPEPQKRRRTLDIGLK